MNVVEAIKQICLQTVPNWGFWFNDRQLMNIDADNLPFPLVFFEEYREGLYRTIHFTDKSTKCELYTGGTTSRNYMQLYMGQLPI